MNKQQPFADLLGGLQQSKLSLVDVIQALNARGQVQAPLHKAELAMLDDALSKKKLDDKMHRLLSAKLKELQAPKATVERTTKQAAYAGDAEKTQMGGGSERTTLNPSSADKTRLNPSAAGDRTTLNPAGGASGDATVVNTGGNGAAGGDGFDLLMGESDSDATEMGDEKAATTGFKPSEPATASRTGGTSGPNTSSWQRVAVSGAPEREVHAGDVLKERFYLEKEVGRGGMGIVFKAKDERKVEAQDKNPWVAVKVLNPEFRKHPQALVALQRESRKAQQLTHDNILRVYDFDKDGTVIYMTMEYCDAGALKDWIKKAPNGMPWEKGWPIIAGLAHGLGRAHRDNIVHSDFKPGNVMMTADGTPKLFDMGIARAAKSGSESKGETTVFDAGELGALTPAYASLEMIQGQPPELIDDIYALGITAYEILTGKHPFNKKNAEQAMKEGLKPPIVPGLSRAQQKCLQQSVAFKREDRLKSCDALIDGMRARSLKDYAVQISAGIIVVILALVGVFGGLLPYLKGKREDAMGAQFAQSTFTDPDTALKALAAMKDSEREETKQRYSKDIQNYFLSIANGKWKVTVTGGKWDRAGKDQHYDYPAALAVANDAKELYPDSAQVAKAIADLDEQKKNVISGLTDEFNDHIDNNRIYEDKAPNVVETMSIIRQVDPANSLVTDKKLSGRYTKDVRDALEAGRLEEAEKRVTTAVKVFPVDKEFAKLQRNVKDAREQLAAAAKIREMQEKMTADDARKELVKLASNPLFTPDWKASVNVAMSKLTADTSAETMKMKTTLGDAYAKQLADKLDGKDLVGAQTVADASMKLFPGMPSLTKELSRLTEAKKAAAAEEAAKAAAAEIDTLKRNLKVKADANDVRSAQNAYDKLKTALPATDPFLAPNGEAAKSLAEAYLRLANKQVEQGRYDVAAQFVANGLKVVPGMQTLKDAEKSIRIDGSVATIQAAAAQVGSASGDKVKAAFDTLRGEDAQRAAKESAAVEGSVVSRIKSLGASDAPSGNKAKAEWLKVFPQNQELAALSFTAAPAATTTTTPAATSSTPAAATSSQSAPQEARKAARAPRGVDTCSSSYSTFGRSGKAQCQDNVNGTPGPKLVVIPAPSGGFLAITKYEISGEQFDAFCSATGKCKPQGGNGALPRTEISVATAKAYAAWLTDQTGFTYRLPTDAEWAHAAGAGGQGPGEDFNCVLMQGSNQIKGGLAVPVTSGKPNAWGLVNIVGNVAELTDGGSARGGNFNTSMSQCTVDSKQGGGESDTVGLRLVREMG